MRIGSLFSGIGGLELGLEWAGLGHTVWQVEADPFCRRILAFHWPDAERFDDVCTVGAATLAQVDLICGGFPCQDVSSAGKGAGLAGSRSGLWFEFARIVGELRPRWVIVENVDGGKPWVDQVCAALGKLGYETIPIPLSAADVGAPHLRRRIFIVAHTNRSGCGGLPRGAVQKQPKPGSDSEYDCRGSAADTTGKRLQGSECEGGEPQRPMSAERAWATWAYPEPSLRRVDDGSIDRMDGTGGSKGIAGGAHRSARLRALGNAVVPQCAEVIGWVVLELAKARIR